MVNMTLSIEDTKKVCSGRDYVILVDNSLSMTTKDCTGGVSRYDATLELIGSITNAIEEFDSDGIEVYMFGHEVVKFEGVTSANLYDKLPPTPTGQATFTGLVLDTAFKDYFSSGATKPVSFICFTDGIPSDPDVLERAIKNAAQAAGNGESVGLSFLQMGNDTRATQHLKKMDDEMGEIDIVDTATYPELMTLLGTTEGVYRLLAGSVID